MGSRSFRCLICHKVAVKKRGQAPEYEDTIIAHTCQNNWLSKKLDLILDEDWQKRIYEKFHDFSFEARMLLLLAYSHLDEQQYTKVASTVDHCFNMCLADLEIKKDSVEFYLASALQSVFSMGYMNSSIYISHPQFRAVMNFIADEVGDPLPTSSSQSPHKKKQVDSPNTYLRTHLIYTTPPVNNRTKKQPVDHSTGSYFPSNEVGKCYKLKCGLLKRLTTERGRVSVPKKTQSFMKNIFEDEEPLSKRSKTDLSYGIDAGSASRKQMSQMEIILLAKKKLEEKQLQEREERQREDSERACKVVKEAERDEPMEDVNLLASNAVAARPISTKAATLRSRGDLDLEKAKSRIAAKCLSVHSGKSGPSIILMDSAGEPANNKKQKGLQSTVNTIRTLNSEERSEKLAAISARHNTGSAEPANKIKILNIEQLPLHGRQAMLQRQKEIREQKRIEKEKQKQEENDRIAEAKLEKERDAAATARLAREMEEQSRLVQEQEDAAEEQRREEQRLKEEHEQQRQMEMQRYALHAHLPHERPIPIQPAPNNMLSRVSVSSSMPHSGQSITVNRPTGVANVFPTIISADINMLTPQQGCTTQLLRQSDGRYVAVQVQTQQPNQIQQPGMLVLRNDGFTVQQQNNTNDHSQNNSVPQVGNYRVIQVSQTLAPGLNQPTQQTTMPTQPNRGQANQVQNVSGHMSIYRPIVIQPKVTVTPQQAPAQPRPQQISNVSNVMRNPSGNPSVGVAAHNNASGVPSSMPLVSRCSPPFPIAPLTPDRVPLIQKLLLHQNCLNDAGKESIIDLILGKKTFSQASDNAAAFRIVIARYRDRIREESRNVEVDVILERAITIDARCKEWKVFDTYKLGSVEQISQLSCKPDGFDA